MRDSSEAACWLSAAPAEVLSAAEPTACMFEVISDEPRLASFTDRAISLVVAACSSTAEAMVFWNSEMRPMIWPISEIASTDKPVSFWIASIF